MVVHQVEPLVDVAQGIAAAGFCGIALGRPAGEEGLRNPEDFIERSENYAFDGTIMAYGLSNYFRVNGDAKRADEMLNKLLSVEDTELWAYFGYLATVAEMKMQKK